MSSKKYALITLALLSGACGTRPASETPAGTRRTEARVPVRIVSAERKQLPLWIEATGTVRARTETTISSRLLASVREVRVRAGDLVAAGHILITLDSRDADAELRRAEAAGSEARDGIPEADAALAGAKAQLDLARATARRLQTLFEKQSVSNQELDESAARLRAAESNVAIAEARRRQLDARIRQSEQAVARTSAMREDTVLRAPYPAIVTARTAEPGTMASPGSPLLVLEQQGAYRFEAAIEESQIAKVPAGAAAEVRIDALQATLRGRVTERTPSADAGSRSILVKIELPAAPGLISGLFGRARFASGSAEKLLIPAAAVRDRGQLRMVFVIDGGMAHARMITSGAPAGDSVEVLSGLDGGEKIAISPAESLADGARVEVRQ